MNKDLNELLELQSENKTLRAENKRLKKVNSLYTQTSLGAINIPGEVLPIYIEREAG